MANKVAKGAKTCGDFGGLTRIGTPCTRAAGWGTDHLGAGCCRSHGASAEDKPLTPQQALFVEEYLVDFNGTQAAIRAGYAVPSAAQQATDLLKRPHISLALKARAAQLLQRLDISQERTLEECRRIAFGDIRDLIKWTGNRTMFVPSDELSAAQAAMVSGVKARHTVKVDPNSGARTHRHELELKTYDKLNALQKLIRFHGMEAEIRMKHTHDLSPVSEMSDEQLIERTLSLAGRFTGGIPEVLNRIGAGQTKSGNGKRGIGG